MATDNSEEGKARAEARFRAAQKKKQDAGDAMGAERAKHDAVLKKTAKLKVLRLAKEAADRGEAPPSPGRPAKRSKKGGEGDR